MPSKARIAGTQRGRSAKAPICPKCKTNEHVIRVWFSGTPQWACKEHYKIVSTKKKPQTMRQRLMHKVPEPDTFGLTEVFVNRRARRAK